MPGGRTEAGGEGSRGPRAPAPQTSCDGPCGGGPSPGHCPREARPSRQCLPMLQSCPGGKGRGGVRRSPRTLRRAPGCGASGAPEDTGPCPFLHRGQRRVQRGTSVLKGNLEICVSDLKTAFPEGGNPRSTSACAAGAAVGPEHSAMLAVARVTSRGTNAAGFPRREVPRIGQSRWQRGEPGLLTCNVCRVAVRMVAVLSGWVTVPAEQNLEPT